MQKQLNRIKNLQSIVVCMPIMLLIELALCFNAYGNYSDPLTSYPKNTFNNNVLIKLDSRLLIAATNIIADANVVVFDNGYSNAVDEDDAIKLGISGEAFAILKYNQLLVVEGRPLINTMDTTFFSTINLLEQNYKLEFVSTNMALQNMTAVLQDNFLGTSTPLNLSGTTTINFSVTTVAASKAVDRFKIVYNPNVLPVTFYSITATNSKNKTTVEWQVQQEHGINEYVVEKSSDGRLFVPMAIVVPSAIPGFQKKYQWIDVNINQPLVYYRVKSIDDGGEEKYSGIVKVKADQQGCQIVTNFTQNGHLNILFKNLQLGNYSIRVVNMSGHTLYTNKMCAVNKNGNQQFDVPIDMPKGLYVVEVKGLNQIKVSTVIFKN